MFHCFLVCHVVPKAKYFAQLSDFRPISLVGSLYKLVPKVLPTGLGNVMEKLIYPNQS